MELDVVMRDMGAVQHSSAEPAITRVHGVIQAGSSLTAPQSLVLMQSRHRKALPAAVVFMLGLCAAVVTPPAHADNKRLNDAVVANVYTIQHHAGCTNDVKINPRLQLAAQWHTIDVLNNGTLDSDIGSDGSTPQDRAQASGFRGKVAETVAINPAIAISGIEILNQWYYDPTDLAIMSDCANTNMGVWSENSLDRTVVVAVYGQPT
jgi:uncharacterized protein YkwD